ncbi:MAG: hypothetical protein IT361_14520 [Gemmatimonadaceae bacterium]|nr:hypothetical protein [Gemmatimonadaceae bacterium]
MTEPESPRPERKNLLLRMLINEMLEQVRDIQRNAGPWSPDERERAEATLDRVMQQVRSEATRRSTE